MHDEFVEFQIHLKEHAFLYSSTLAVPNRVFYSESIELKSKALDNIENVITRKEQNDIELEIADLLYLKISSYLKTI